MRHFLSNIAYLTRYILRYAPSAIILIILNAVFHTISIISNVLGIKFIIDEFERGTDVYRIVFIALIYAIVRLSISIYFNISGYYTSKIYATICHRVDIDLMKKSNITDYSCFDDPTFYDKHTRAMKTASSSVNNLIGTYTAVLSNLVAVFAVTTLLSTIGIEYIIISLVSVLISTTVLIYKNKKQYEYGVESTRNNRQVAYFKTMVFNPENVADIRVNGTIGFFVEKYKRHYQNWFSQYLKHLKKMSLADLPENIASSVAFFLTMFFAIRDVVMNIITLGTYVSTINAVQSLSQQIFSLVFQFPNLIQQVRYIDDLKKILELPSTIEEGKANGVELKMKNAYKIEFKHVTFSYPNTDVKVLDNISFSIKTGEKVAIVGENGAGKTTLIKLLLRLYDPQDGEICIDNINIKDIDINSLRRTISMVFQKVNIYPLTVRENIAFNNEVDDDIIMKYLKSANIYDKIVVNSLIGLDSQVTRSFYEDGIVLSGGENQKLAIARALYKRAGIIVMDEPSSSLDPNSEYELFKTFRFNTHNQTALIISHRLAICTSVDKIVFIHNGTVVEQGSHDELMQMENGRYRNLFTKQLSSYMGEGG